MSLVVGIMPLPVVSVLLLHSPRPFCVAYILKVGGCYDLMGRHDAAAEQFAAVRVAQTCKQQTSQRP